MAFGDFRKLRKLWGHTSIGVARKVELFNAIILPKLLYSLSALVLNATETRRLDGAHCRMLRAICGVKHPMISHISNDTIRSRTGQTPLSAMLLKHQLLLFGKAARGGPGDPLRDSVFSPGVLSPITDTYVRRVGAPRLEWAKHLRQHAERACRESQNLNEAVSNPADWGRQVRLHCMSDVRLPTRRRA